MIKKEPEIDMVHALYLLSGEETLLLFLDCRAVFYIFYLLQEKLSITT